MNWKSLLFWYFPWKKGVGGMVEEGGGEDLADSFSKPMVYSVMAGVEERMS